MSFHVKEQYIRQFGQRLEGLAEDATAAEPYADRHLDIGHADARLFFNIAMACSNLRDALIPNYKVLARVADASATELRETAAMYETTDADAARQLDDTY
ncbi:type VII secretion target [Haloechinothrix sp. LS1_15]|uniref:type VII secretion target n=1 Tax=Haloechinothrix sp. LS1_15 TaxID=2652248 RepID=UPI00294B23A5|nr:type VII secretion target [Haloechinothrix sp. LS1_15]